VRGRDSAQLVTPFVRVGTSCTPPITGGTDYNFDLSADHFVNHEFAPAARVHRRRDSRDLAETIDSQMHTLGNLLTHSCEPFEIEPLTRQERVAPEMRDDTFDEVPDVPYLVLQCLVAAVGSDAPALEVIHHEMEYLSTIAILTDREARAHLPSRSQRRPPIERDGEATLTVDVSRHI